MTLSEAADLAVQFGLGSVRELVPIVKGSVNSNFRLELEGGSRVFLRVCEESDFEAVCLQNAMLQEWVAQGVTTPSPIALVSGEGSVARHRDKPVAAFAFRPGDSVCQKQVQPAHLEQLGQELARIHRVGLAFASRAPASRFSMRDLLKRLETVRGSGRRELMADCARLQPRIEALMDIANCGADVVHGDLFRDNVLWHDPKKPERGLSAILDFESASRGNRIFDLMVALMAWCFGNTLQWPLVQALVRGYRQQAELTEDDFSACYDQARAACVRFAVTRMTDYELRSANEVTHKDYRRFMQRLQVVEALGKSAFGQRLSDLSRLG